MAGSDEGRIIRVDLATGRVSFEDIDGEFLRLCFGGQALIAWRLLQELPPGVDPLGPENKLIFAAGVLTGSGVPGTGRHAVGGKSPLTGGFATSEAGGRWGAALRRAGYLAMIVESAAPGPVYVVVDDGEVSVRNAGDLWGKSTLEVQETIRSRFAGKRVQVAQCGMAGEALVPYASVVHDLTHFAGRTGMGAVMGAKKLRAVVVSGTGKIEVCDRQAVAELGGDAVDAAVEVKGQEAPMHEPRSRWGLGLGYALSPTGADHCHNLHDPGFETTARYLDGSGAVRPVPSRDLSPAKIRLFKRIFFLRQFQNSALVCLFMPWNLLEHEKICRAVTGWGTTALEIMEVGQRAFLLGVCFNRREGIDRDQDRLPRRFLEPFRAGRFQGRALDGKAYADGLALAGDMVGLDASGNPRPGTLADLGIEWAWRDLEG